MNILNNDTICALATGSNNGAVAMIRLSGKDAFSIMQNLFQPKSKQVNLTNPPIRQALYGDFTYQGEVLDDVIVLYFQGPHSYTGEDSVEITCHGSTYIRQQILKALMSKGARMAEAGEYTQRAYLNGRMDLSSAEAVADIIASESKAQHQMAMKQLRGGYSQEFNELREELLRFTGLMELELDFAEEDVEFADRSELLKLQKVVVAKIQKLIDSFKLGNAVKNGVPVAIVGATNVGKSTLLNRLLGEERAIVSDIHGTTRDTIEDTIHLGGYLFRFVDTAGIRETKDEIEALGIERSRNKIQEAQIILAVLDAQRIEETEDIKTQLALLPEDSEAKVILLINKTENLSAEECTGLEEKLKKSFALDDVISISAKEELALDKLKDKLISLMEEHNLQSSDIIVSNLRHHELLLSAKECLERLAEGLSNGFPTDLLTFELRSAISSIGEITGQAINRDDTLHYIFKHFCIGK